MQTHSDDAVPGLPFHECFPPLTSLPLCALDDYSLITWTGKLFPPLCRCCDPTSSSLCYNCLCLKTPSLISSGVSRSADGDVSASCSLCPTAVWFRDTCHTHVHLPQPGQQTRGIRHCPQEPAQVASLHRRPFLSLCLSRGFYFAGHLTKGSVLTEDRVFWMLFKL